MINVFIFVTTDLTFYITCKIIRINIIINIYIITITILQYYIIIRIHIMPFLETRKNAFYYQ